MANRELPQVTGYWAELVPTPKDADRPVRTFSVNPKSLETWAQDVLKVLPKKVRVVSYVRFTVLTESQYGELIRYTEPVETKTAE